MKMFEIRVIFLNLLKKPQINVMIMKTIILSLISMIISTTAFSQSLNVFDVDLSEFPLIKANFYLIDENGNQITDFSISDFRVKEDGIDRKVTNIWCPEPKEPAAISSVLTIDVSGSMEGNNLATAKEAALEWINTIPLGKSECAITSFDSKNYLNRDFTTEREKLIDALDGLAANGGTDFNAGFIDPLSGALLIAENGVHKRVIVFLTDGFSSGDEMRIIQKANSMNAAVYCVTVGSKCPEILKNISLNTGGKWFENINSAHQAKSVYRQILTIAQNSEPCTIEWLSEKRCDNDNIDVAIEIKRFALSDEFVYNIPWDLISKLTFSPAGVYFRNYPVGEKSDTTLTVTAHNGIFDVTAIVSSNPNFSVSPGSFILKDGESIELKLSFTPDSKYYVISDIIFENDLCTEKYICAGGHDVMPPAKNTLRITHPNGGEKFPAGIDTMITWEGILPTDTVRLELSRDNGKNWELISDKATGLKYRWNNITIPVSDECLIRATIDKKYNDPPAVEWSKNYGGSDYDHAQEIIQTNDGGYLIGATTKSIDLDISNPKNPKGIFDIWLIKINSKGEIEWDKNYGGSYSDNLNSIKQTVDGGYIIAGGTSSNDGDIIDTVHGYYDWWIFKINSAGEILWSKTLGGTKNNSITQIIQVSDGGYLAHGISNSNDLDFNNNYGQRDIWIVKLDPEGNIIWKRNFGGSENDFSSSAVETTNGNYLLIGQTNSNDGDVSNKYGKSDIWIFKLNSIGELIWEKNYGGSYNDSGDDILISNDSNYIFSGNTESFDHDLPEGYGKSDAWIVKINSSGEFIWKETYGGAAPDRTESIAKTHDGGYIIAGSTRSRNGDIVTGNKGDFDAWIFKVDSYGKLKWHNTLGGLSYESFNSVIQTYDGGFIAVGITESKEFDISENYGKQDVWVVKLAPDTDGPAQSDTSDAVFSIVAPEVTALDIDMKKALVGEVKDSVVSNFIVNTGTYQCRVDSIYFRGADSAAFGLVSGLPVFSVDPGNVNPAEFRFAPQREGLHQAEIVIVTQADTLLRNIAGEGIKPQIEMIADIIDFGKLQIGESKDTTVFLLKNSSAGQVEITKTELLGPDTDHFEIISGGGAFSLNPDESRELALKFKPEELGRTNSQIGFYYDGTGSPAKTQLFGEGIWGCDETGFAYNDFSYSKSIKFVGEASQVDSAVRLTPPRQLTAGAIWYGAVVPVASGFSTTFSFSMNYGSNGDAMDGSYPGADGIAFVIQNGDSAAIGKTGGNIGYEGIENAIAIEFDLFANDKNQITNKFDPNGNHVAIQSLGTGEIKADHTEDATIAINTEIPEIPSDGTVFYAKIEYNYEPGVMNVFLDRQGKFGRSSLVADSLHLDKLLDLEFNEGAYVGFTSATGKAYQEHKLLSWYFCPKPTDGPFVSVKEEPESREYNFEVFPNPAEDKLDISLSLTESGFTELAIYNVMGEKVQTVLSENISTFGNMQLSADVSGLGSGQYMLILKTPTHVESRMIVVVR